MSIVRFAAFVAASTVALAQEPPRSLVGRLPAETVAVIEWRDGASIARGTLEVVREAILPMRVRIGAGLVQAAIRNRSGFDFVELAGEFTPLDAVVGLASVDGENWPFLVARRPDGADPAELIEAIGGLWPQAVARGIDDLFAVAPDEQAWQTLADRLRGAGDRLQDRRPELASRLRPEPDGGLRLWVDLARLRSLSPKPWRAEADAFNQLVFGPWVAALQAADTAMGSIVVARDGIDMTVELDGSALADEHVAALIAVGGPERMAPRPPAGTVATVSMDRSVGELFRSRDRLLDDAQATSLAGFLAIADTLTGASFIDDLLGGLGEPWTLHVVDDPQTSPPSDPLSDPPFVSLPSFVLIAPVARPEVEDVLTRTFRNTFFAGNFDRRRQGRPIFQVRRARTDGGRLMWIAETEAWRGPPPAPVDVTLSPTLVVTDGFVVLSTTRAGAEAAVQGIETGESIAWRGDVVRGDAGGIAAVLERNRERIVLDEVLKKGEPIAEVGRRTDDLLGVLRAFGGLELSWLPGPGSTTVQLRAELRR